MIMKKFKPNLPFCAGVLIFLVVRTVSQFFSIPKILHLSLLLAALSLASWGMILIFRSPEMKNSKLRQWKLRLIGRGQK